MYTFDLVYDLTKLKSTRSQLREEYRMVCKELKYNVTDDLLKKHQTLEEQIIDLNDEIYDLEKICKKYDLV